MELKIEWHGGIESEAWSWRKPNDWCQKNSEWGGGGGNCLAALKSSEMTGPALVIWRDWPPHKIDKDEKPHNKQFFLTDI